jgi:serine/threonine protein kinase
MYPPRLARWPDPSHHEQQETDDIMDEGLSFADAALQKEVYIWSQLSDHPHIVPLLHFHETDFASFIFMPLCGGNLLQYVRLNGKGTYGGGGIQNSPPMMSNSTTPKAILASKMKAP